MKYNISPGKNNQMITSLPVQYVHLHYALTSWEGPVVEISLLLWLFENFDIFLKSRRCMFKQLISGYLMGYIIIVLPTGAQIIES